MFWTVQEIAKETGLTEQHITRLIRQGTIKAQRKQRAWWIDDDEARRFIELRKNKK